MGHARALLGLGVAAQTSAASRIVAQGLSVRETERLVHHLAHPGKPRPKRGAKAPDPDAARLAQELSDVLAATVTIEPRKGGAGRLVIAYASLDELDGIIAKLR
jgi:ParB family chromosome partitioning protein